MINLILSLALVSAPPMDKLAHFGLSFATNTALLALCLKGVDRDYPHREALCYTLAAGTTLGLGVAKEISDGARNSSREHLLDLGADALGVGSSIFVIKFGF